MRDLTRLRSLTVVLGTLLGVQNSFATPDGLTFQGRLMKSGVAVEGLVDLTIKITNAPIAPATTECLLYEETHSLNMAGSGGAFSVRIGGGTRTANDENLSLLTVFSNRSETINGSGGLDCTGSPSATSITPQEGLSRYVYISFVDGPDTVSFSTPYVIQSVPYALEAQRLAGLSKDEFLQTNANTTQSKLNAIMTSTEYTELLALINGTSSKFNFTPTSAVNFNGQNIVNSTGLTLSGTAARSVTMDRQLTSGSPGNSLTVSASGAASGATNASGGNLVLSSGTATGSASSSIEFQTAGSGASGTADSAPSTKMTILGNGNVGIGTASPSTKLDVNGTINATVFTINGTPVGTSTSSYWNASGVDLSYTLGKVGVGTASPAGVLDVQGGTAASGNHGASIYLAAQNANDGNMNGGHIFLLPGSNSGSGQAGALAIGTSSIPSYVSANSIYAPSGNFYGSRVIVTNSIGFGDNTKQIGHGSSGATGYMTFSTDSAEKMRLKANGNLGVGTIDPQEKLEVNGGVKLNTATVKPACSSTARGTFWFTQGGAGDADSAEVCAKAADGSYAWRTLF